MSASALDRITQRAGIVWTKRVSQTLVQSIADGTSVEAAMAQALNRLNVNQVFRSVTDQTLELLGKNTGIQPNSALSRRAVAVGAGFQQRTLSHLAKVSEADLRSAVSQYQRGILTLEQVAEQVPAGRIQNLVNTSLAGVQRIASREYSRSISDSGEVLFLYSGPTDQAARPYCAALAGKVVSEQMLANTPNGQGLPPLVYCGGWNCRHSLVPVNERIATVQGLKRATLQDYLAAKQGARAGRRVA